MKGRHTLPPGHYLTCRKYLDMDAVLPYSDFRNYANSCIEKVRWNLVIHFRQSNLEIKNTKI